MFPAVRRAVTRHGANVIGAAPGLVSRSFARSRLLSTLAVLEQRDGKLSAGSLGAFTAAKKLGGTVHGFIAGGSVSAAAQEAAKVDGVEKIISVDKEAYEKVGRPIWPIARSFMPVLLLNHQ